MSLHFKSNIAVERAGWNPISSFEKQGKEFRVLAERTLSIAQRAFQAILLFFAVVVSCGYILQNDWGKQWKCEVQTGKISSYVFCELLEQTAQPGILSDRWGEITVLVNGRVCVFRDVVITPTEANEWRWDWNSAFMEHHPGIREMDLDHFFLLGKKPPDVVILSQGRGHGVGRDNQGAGALHVDLRLQGYLLSKGVREVYILKTAAAIDLYCKLVQRGQKNIAALLHSTC